MNILPPNMINFSRFFLLFSPLKAQHTALTAAIQQQNEQYVYCHFYLFHLTYSLCVSVLEFIELKVFIDHCKQTSYMGACVCCHTVTIMYRGIWECHGQQTSWYASAAATDSISEMTNNNLLLLFWPPQSERCRVWMDGNRSWIGFVLGGMLLLVQGVQVHTVP